MVTALILAPLLAILPRLASAAQAQIFSPPSECPTCLSSIYPGGSPNGSLDLAPVVSGQGEFNHILGQGADSPSI